MRHSHTRLLRLRRALLAALLAALTLAVTVAGVMRAGPTDPVRPVQYAGVNLSVAEFGEHNLPGTHGVDFIYPTRAEVDYFVGKGMNLLRLPFRWERLQPKAFGAFDAAEQARMDDFVAYATGRGASVLLDPHNYARYYGGLLGREVPHDVFADFWGKLAARYKGNPRVVFGLMNEPHDMPTELWRDSANAAIRAIRASGATNLITVPGNSWTGAHSWSQSWYGTPNAVAMLGIQDPGNNFVFEVHQYLDGDSSGRSEYCVSESIGAERLAGFTDWLRRNGKRAILGEFGGGRNQTCYAAMDTMLRHIHQNTDVWAGWAYWAAGPWWGDYIYTLEPVGGQDRPQMAVLSRYLGVSQPPASLPTATATAAPAQPTATKVPATAVPPTATAAPAQPTATAAPAQPTAVPPAPPATGQLSAQYTVVNSWDTGYVVDVVVTNGGSSAVSGWKVSWQLAHGETFSGAWNADCRLQSGTVTCASKDYNATLAPGAKTSFGLQAVTSGGKVTRPATLTVNGANVALVQQVAPTAVLATAVPATAVPATAVPATAVPATAVPATAVPATAVPVTGSLTARHNVQSVWDSGYVVEVLVTNGGSSTVSGWKVSWQLAHGETFSGAWNADCRVQSGTVTCTSKDYNAALAPGAQTSFGLQAVTSGGKVTRPATLTVNGAAVAQ
ncbi:MAG: endoglucanase precursor (endo,4-beta-glucanase)(cellulase) protein [Chloroflexota bacterium]|jgi:endoglucanase